MHTYSSGLDLGFAEGIGVNLNIVSLKQGVWGTQLSRSYVLVLNPIYCKLENF